MVSRLGERMPPVDDELEIFGEQRPGIEPVPVFADFGGDAEFGLALLQIFADLAGVAAQEAEFQPVELPLDLVEMRNQAATRSIEWVSAILSAPTSPLLKEEASCPRAARRLVALLEQRMHALAEFGQLRCRPFAPEQVAAEFGLELLDRPRQRRLRNVALVGGAREIQRPRDGEEVPDLMHFHDRAAPIFPAGNLADRGRQ